jgi:hypothetical protein
MKDLPTVIVRLVGGLGNQMFQYAMGVAVASRVEGRLLLDADFVGSGIARREFELDKAFVGPFQLATAEERRAALGWRAHFLKAIGRPAASFIRDKRVVVERGSDFSSAFTGLSAPVYLVGYWQSESYFLNVTRELRERLRFVPPDAANQTVLREISACESVAMHIRRGDYAEHNSIMACHGLCPPSYYERAAEWLMERKENLRFFLFSDDLEWTRDNIKLPAECTYVDVNRGGYAFNDMRLMSRCGHQVIANSTFSWWAAWLNDNPEKLVIAPQRWFASGSPASSICPHTWVRL